MLKIGSLVDNKYKILSEVGHGGMSVVYLAINERANKTWAVKEVRKDGVCDFEAVKQGLVVETDMLKRLNHPYLPSIIDVIDTEDSFLIVMDYIEGKSLQSVLKNGAQPYELVIKWAMQLCDVLGYLHSREPAIIYRDMKPANVMLKPSGDITLIDFGTAREFKNRAMVEDTTCLGTRGYAAPEQFGGRGQTDPRTDIYCLGATMYHLITGHSPAEPPYEIKPLSYWDPSFYGSGIEHVISKCCQQDPNQRYQSCAELMYDLENIGDLDEQAKRKRKQKWAAFISSVALFGVGLVGMLGFSFARNAAVKDSYDGLIRDAKGITGAENFQEFVGYIDQAIEVDAGRYEAYDVLLSRVEEDGRLDSQTEWSPIVACTQDKDAKNGRANEDYLLSADKADYGGCDITIICGSDGMITSTCENKIVPNGKPVEGEKKYTLSTTVVDATTNAPVMGAKIKVFAGYNTFGDFEEATTDSAGKVVVNLKDSGMYTVEISRDGYITEKFEVQIMSNLQDTQKSFYISPVLSDNAIRFVLSWGASPSDLDCHLEGRAGDGTYTHIYFSNMYQLNGGGQKIAELDVDDTNSFGPETVTLYDMNGSFDFYIDDYTNSGTISASGATVKIYVGSALYSTVVIPAGVSDLWHVCTVSGGTVTVTNRGM